MPAGRYTPQPFTARLRAATRARGPAPVAGELAATAARALAGLPWTLRGRRGAFVLDGRTYPYLYHRYKRSWLSERAVEVPVVQAAVDRHAGRRVLEVGNVLSHFGPQSHVVVDKYERAPGVLNRDVLDLHDLGSFDLIVAVSTIEHVGWDEQRREPDKALRALEQLRGLLAPGGELLVTVPAGYNPALDDALAVGATGVAAASALRRTGAGTRWVQVAPAEALTAPYDFLTYSARAVVFAGARAPD